MQPRFSDEDGDLRVLHWIINRCGYAKRCAYAGRVGGKQKNRMIMAHRVVLSRMLGRELTQADLCDHIDRDPLNNCRDNLRLTDHAGNSQNRRATGPCGIRGVHFHARSRKWVAMVKHKGRVHYCGAYLDPAEAGKAAEAKRKELGFLGA